jgi:glycerol-3-phosphate dehydrogenase
MIGPSPVARRAATLRRLATEEFDVLVVGGGATGAGIARDAALRGLRVALCEAGDFAGQTSSGSSKLIHGGLRYLQYGDFRLVFEGLAERRHLMTIAPHLCRPIEFLFPGYRGERPGLITLGAGIAIYNSLALWRPPASARRYSAEELQAAVPFLRSDGLRGAQAYVDCQTDDARLVLENVLDAEAAGAAIESRLAVAAVARDERGRARGAAVGDRTAAARGAGAPSFTVRARVIVNATGPFSDTFDRGRHNLRPTLGVHLVFDAARLPHGGRALVLRTPQDNRLFFMLPAGPRTIVGTTDTDWAPPGGPRSGSGRAPRLGDEIRARGSDVAYLLEATNHAFPPARLGPGDVISTYAALRPLVAGPGHTPSETSREHEIVREPDGLLTVAGGKLTTLRRMAEETVDRVAEILRDGGREGDIGPCVTATRPLPGAGPPPESMHAHELATDVQQRLETAYGARAGRVLALLSESPELARRIDPELPYLWVEVVHAARAEHGLDLGDVFVRRVPVFRDARDQGLAAAPRAAALLGAELAWPPERCAQAVADYGAVVETSRRWRRDPA